MFRKETDASRVCLFFSRNTSSSVEGVDGQIKGMFLYTL
jgi:hypothetical protein